jgi:tetratricopeptide (TPR) repeat protein
VNLLIVISEEYWGLNIDSSNKYSSMAINLSKKISYTKGVANAIATQSSAYFYQGDLDSAINIGKRALKLEIQLGEKKSIGKRYNNIGMFYDESGKYDSALVLYNKALKIFKEIKFLEGEASTFGNMGVMYRQMGNYIIAIDYFLKTSRILEKLDNKNGLATSYTNLGILYANQNDYNEALKYFKNSLRIYEELKNYNGIQRAHQNVGSLYFFLNNMDTALFHFKITEEMLLKTSNILDLVPLYDNMGSAYKLKNNNELAQFYFKKAMHIADSLGNENIKITLYKNLGNFYSEIKRYDEAIKYCTKSYNIASQMKYAREISEACMCLFSVYEKTGNISLAYKFYKEHILFRDSILNESNTKEITQKQMEYSFEKQQFADSIKRAEELKINEYTHKQDIKNQKIYSYTALFGLLLMASLAFVLFRSNIHKKRNNIQLEEKNRIISLQKLEVEEKHKEITDSINYAERIQRSFLATSEMLDKYLSSPFATVIASEERTKQSTATEEIASLTTPTRNDGKGYFVFFRPKDVVSGDFYWAAELKNGNFAFSCADSTGHGVPGAIMSILNISSLEKSIEQETEPHKILNQTRKIIIERLKKDGSAEGGKDGMDCSLFVINKDKTQLSFASANNSVFILRPTVIASEERTKQSDALEEEIALLPPIVRNEEKYELFEYKPDKMPVGKHEKEHEPFTLHTIQLQKGDVIYTLTDGFQDQFGGEKVKKYMLKNVKNLLLQIAHLPMHEQEQKLAEEFNAWKGSNEQIDDVCVIGVKI